MDKYYKKQKRLFSVKTRKKFIKFLVNVFLFFLRVFNLEDEASYKVHVERFVMKCYNSPTSLHYPFYLSTLIIFIYHLGRETKFHEKKLEFLKYRKMMIKLTRYAGIFFLFCFTLHFEDYNSWALKIASLVIFIESVKFFVPLIFAFNFLRKNPPSYFKYLHALITVFWLYHLDAVAWVFSLQLKKEELYKKWKNDFFSDE